MDTLSTKELAQSPHEAPRAFAMDASQKKIVIIEGRALFRDCLARNLGKELGRPVVAFPDLASWQGRTCGTQALAILLGASRRSDKVADGERFRALTSGESSAPVIVLSDEQDKENVATHLKNGARGYVPTDTPLEIVVEAIRLVLAGGLFIPANILLSATAKTASKESSRVTGDSPFTSREIEVMEALREGKPNKVIAHELRLSESTIKQHVHNLMKKLDASNRTEAVVKIGQLSIAVAN